LLECFGKPMGENGVIGPGLHLKPPWPIGRTIPYHTERVQTFLVGADPEPTQTIAWTVAHAKEENFLVASRGLNTEAQTNQQLGGKSPPVSLVSVSIPVQYQITNLAVWAYTNEDPVTLLTNIAEREVIQYLASADFDDLMSRGRGAAAEALRQSIQKQADFMNLGARIILVGLEDIHPPTKVAEVFEKVVGASEIRESKILQALAHAISTNAWARGESNKIVMTAEADRHGAITNAAARALLFANQIRAYSAAPGAQGVYEQQAYLAALVENSAEARKYILATTNAPNIPIFDLEDKINPALLTDKLPSPNSK
jgi:regulator of protease activity HflC (stomatin/prohibitin superfamily)